MKRIFDPLSTALVSVMTHKLRSFLTVLGVVIGIAAVIILMSVGRGAEAAILSAFDSLGANMITISPGTSSTSSSSAGGVRVTVRGGFGSATTLTREDAQAIEANVTGITGVAPTSNTGMQIIAGSQNMFAMVTGVTPNYFDLYSIQIQSGESITQEAYDRYQKIAVIGPTLSETLFEGDDPVGQKIRMGTNIFTIIGLLESKGQSFFSSDNSIYVPLTTLQGLMSKSTTSTGQHSVNSIAVQAADKDSISSAKEQITLLLEDRHRIAAGADDDFMLTSTDEITASITSSMQSMTILLGAIAGISLLVGGIGVMNIMLVSVMERRREIGIRKALGAKERDIWGQFLIDSALLTLTGGIIGIAIGWGGSFVLGRYFESMGYGMSTLVTSDIVILAVAVSVGIGLFFGFYPAWQGSRMDPIQALRSE